MTPRQVGRQLRRRPSAVAVAAALTLASVAAPAAAQTDTEAERDEVRERRAAVVEQLDVLSATDAEITAALDELDAAIADQQAAVSEAEAAVAAAEAEVRSAEAALRRAQRDIEILEAAIIEMAVASYVHPPSADLVQSLQAASLSDAVLAQAYLDARAQRDIDLLGLLETAEDTAAQRRLEVAAAADAAVDAAAAEATALQDLQLEQGRQLRFAVDLQDRIDASLAEAAVLADLDAELSEQIAAEQRALLARIPPPPVIPEPPSAPPPPPTTVPPTTVAPATTVTPGDPVPPTTTTTTTAPPPPTTVPSSPDRPPLRTVQGITVHVDIADDVDALLRAAAADGVYLSGWGYRSTQRQIELRIINCGPTTYDIWLRPASTCNPPTAVPGRSLHEQGRAIDFTVGGRVITSRNTDAFRWMAANASSYGLYNLPSEPWHWSTTGG